MKMSILLTNKSTILLLESLSTGVSEPWTAAGNGTFSSLMLIVSFCSQIQVVSAKMKTF